MHITKKKLVLGKVRNDACDTMEFWDEGTGKLQWILDLTKCQGTVEIGSLYQGSFHTLHYYWAEKYRSLDFVI